MIKFEVVTDPIPLARPRFGRGRAYLPKRSQEYRKTLTEAARNALGAREPLTGELTCKLEFYRKWRRSARNFGDVDNHVKAALDSFNGLLFRDDAQIVEVVAVKYTDKERPRLVVTLDELDLKKK